ncbi:hypothetical protein BDF14DRAFT_1725865 [Spinellus fusiger]|nr:hypothetical protein BDF14DRAFT_1725865 [Spinellus fusiger]
MSKALIVFLLSVTCTFLCYKYTGDVVYSWLADVFLKCSEAAHQGDNSVIGGTHIGIPSIDKNNCILFVLLQSSFRPLLGRPINTILFIYLGTVYLFFTLESSRRQVKNTVLAWPVLWIVLSSIIGVSGTVCALYVPLHIYYVACSPVKVTEAWSVPSSRTNAILLSSILGYYIITIIYLFFVDIDTTAEKTSTMAWSIMPLLVPGMAQLFEYVFLRLGSTNATKDPVMTKHMSIVQNKMSVERAYMLLGAFNIFAYYGTYFYLSFSGVMVIPAFVDLIAAAWNPPVGLSFTELSGLMSAYILLIDTFLTALGFMIWAVAQGNIINSVLFTLGNIVIGPGAALCFFAAYREGLLEHTSHKTIEEKSK